MNISKYTKLSLLATATTLPVVAVATSIVKSINNSTPSVKSNANSDLYTPNIFKLSDHFTVSDYQNLQIKTTYFARDIGKLLVVVTGEKKSEVAKGNRADAIYVYVGNTNGTNFTKRVALQQDAKYYDSLKTFDLKLQGTVYEDFTIVTPQSIYSFNVSTLQTQEMARITDSSIGDNLVTWTSFKKVGSAGFTAVRSDASYVEFVKVDKSGPVQEWKTIKQGRIAILPAASSITDFAVTADNKLLLSVTKRENGTAAYNTVYLWTGADYPSAGFIVVIKPFTVADSNTAQTHIVLDSNQNLILTTSDNAKTSPVYLTKAQLDAVTVDNSYSYSSLNKMNVDISKDFDFASFVVNDLHVDSIGQIYVSGVATTKLDPSTKSPKVIVLGKGINSTDADTSDVIRGTVTNQEDYKNYENIYQSGMFSAVDSRGIGFEGSNIYLTTDNSVNVFYVVTTPITIKIATLKDASMSTYKDISGVDYVVSSDTIHVTLADVTDWSAVEVTINDIKTPVTEKTPTFDLINQPKSLATDYHVVIKYQGNVMEDKNFRIKPALFTPNINAIGIYDESHIDRVIPTTREHVDIDSYSVSEDNLGFFAIQISNVDPLINLEDSYLVQVDDHFEENPNTYEGFSSKQSSVQINHYGEYKLVMTDVVGNEKVYYFEVKTPSLTPITPDGSNNAQWVILGSLLGATVLGIFAVTTYVLVRKAKIAKDNKNATHSY